MRSAPSSEGAPLAGMPIMACATPRDSELGLVGFGAYFLY